MIDEKTTTRPTTTAAGDKALLDPTNGSNTSLTPDTFPNHDDTAAQQLRSLSKEEYDELERKTVRKMDLRMVPWLT